MGEFSPAIVSNSTCRRTETNTCLILQYHRIALLHYDPLQLAVEPHKFESQMEYLSQTCNVIPMDEMYRHITTGRAFGPRTVVVTFDGGYSDILYTAKEILERYRIFATVFCPSANIMKRREFWWDRLEDYIIANCTGHGVEVEIDNYVFKRPLRTQAERFRAYAELYSIMIEQPPWQQQAILEQIGQGNELTRGEPDNHSIMDGGELKKLAESGLVTIGGYTHNCVKLPSLAPWQQVEEIVKNKTILQEVLAREIDCFCYPFGNSDGCVSTKTVEILKNAGFSLACGNLYGVVSTTHKINRYDLPRVRAGNCNVYAFHGFLERFFG